MPVVVPPTPHIAETLSLNDLYYMQTSYQSVIQNLKEECGTRQTAFFELQSITAKAKESLQDRLGDLKTAREKLKAINKSIRDREEERATRLVKEREEAEEKQNARKKMRSTN